MSFVKGSHCTTVNYQLFFASSVIYLGPRRIKKCRHGNQRRSQVSSKAASDVHVALYGSHVYLVSGIWSTLKCKGGICIIEASHKRRPAIQWKMAGSQ